MTKNLTRALRQSEFLYRRLFESHPQAMWVYDLQSLGFLMVNNAAISRYGYSNREFLEMTIEDIRPSDDLPTLLASIEEGRHSFHNSGVWRHRRKDGRIILAEVSSHPFVYNGRSAKLVIVHDVTERVATEEKARESQELFRAVSHVTADVIWDWNIAAGTISWNAGLETVFGHSPEESSNVYLFWEMHVHPEDRERVVRSKNSALDRHAETWGEQYRFFRSDGSTAHVEDSGYIIYSNKDKPLRFVGGMKDISDRKKAEEKLARQAALLDKAQDAIIVQGIDHKILFWNKGAERIYGWNADEAVGMPVGELLYRRASEFPGIEAVVMTSGEWSGEIEQKRKDGSHLTVEARSSLMRDVAGKPDSILSINTEITQRLAVEEQLRQAQRLEAIGQLTGGVAHDFNNLLTVILGNAEILAEQLDDNTNLRALAEMTLSAAERGAELTHRLLAFARRQPLEPKTTRINPLLRGMDGLLRRTLSEDIEIEFIQGGGLWNAFVDSSQLEAAVLNLCINARDAMPDGGRLTIETANASLDQNYANWNPEVAAGQYVLVAISDTGTGMSADIAERAFEPFFTTKEAGKGSGLGLSMVFGFARQSMGHVKIYTEVGQGTTVKLYFPRAMAVHEKSQPFVKRIGALGGTEKILLVEDDALVRSYVVLQLEGLGYTVISTENGQEALDCLKKFPDIDLIFTDVVMPGGLNGRQLAERASEIRPDVPVLFTSGYTENAIVHHGRLDRGVHLLNKPYRPQDLATKVRLMLDGRKTART